MIVYKGQKYVLADWGKSPFTKDWSEPDKKEELKGYTFEDIETDEDVNL